jgi:hypothetical protein
VVTFFAPGLTGNDPTFCTRSVVYYVFGMILETDEFISLHRIKRLAFLIETGCVYCALRTESLNTFRLNSVFRVLLKSLSYFCPVTFTYAAAYPYP